MLFNGSVIIERASLTWAQKALRSGPPVTELAELGHHPQIEQPERIAELVQAFASGWAG